MADIKDVKAMSIDIRAQLAIMLRQRPRYTLGELLAQCSPKVRRCKDEREWLDTKPAGRELI
jgi:antitoxin ChpS